MIGFIFQSYNLIAQYTVLENIEDARPLLPAGGRRRPTGRNRCLDLAEMVGLGERLQHRPYRALGRSAAARGYRPGTGERSEIILADEPTGNLDSATGDEIMQLLTRLNREGRTIVMVTHEPDVAEMAKHQIHMKDGVIDYITANGG